MTVSVGVDNDIQLILPKGSGSGLEATISLNEPIIAPFEEQKQVGNLTLSLEGAKINTYPIVTLNAVPEGSWANRILDIIRLQLR